MDGKIMVLVVIVAVTVGCFAFMVLSLRKLKKGQDRKNQHFDKVSEVIVENKK